MNHEIKKGEWNDLGMAILAVAVVFVLLLNILNLMGLF